MDKFKRILLLFVVPIPFISLAQNPNQGIEVARMQWQAKRVIPPSPDAAELGKYGNVPVSLFTGTPNISVPLFELKGNSISLPISLSYNASGYKPEDAASWVGSGWALNGGGVITRSAMGNPDNDNNYFGVTNILNPPTSNNVFDYYTYMLDIQYGTREAQPDVYYYNFGGHSGKFLLKPDYSVFKKERDLKVITPCISNNCSTSQFTIVDEQGITYVFDQTETTHIIPFDDAGNPNQTTYDFVSAWYLHYMYSADGNDVIEFEYYSSTGWQFVYQNLIPNQSVSYTWGDQSGGSCCGTNHVNDDNSSIQIPPTVSMKRKYLKKITHKKLSSTIAYVEIISATGQRDDSDFGEDRRVNQLKMYSTSNGTDRLVKQYNFSYSYFGNAGATGGLAYLQKRLRLDNVQEISTDVNTTSPPAYTFTYNTSDWSPRFTASLDHWGFYNASGNSGLVPNYYFPGSPDGQHPAKNIGQSANRNPSLIGSSATLLTKIQYPTGGYTTFDFELNYAKFANDAMYGPVGGVRIKEMTDYSFQNKQAITKRYTYTLDDEITTSGKTGYFPEYKKETSYHHFPGLVCCSPLSGCTCEANVWPKVDYTLSTISMSANSVFGLGSFQGSHVGYTQVTESQVDLATNQPLGKTVYNYSSGGFGEYDEDLANGNLIKQSVYRNDGKLLQQTESNYQYLGTDIITGHIPKGEGLQTNKPYFCRYGTSNDYYNYGDTENPPNGCTNVHTYPTKLYVFTYTIQNQYKNLTQQTIKLYDQLSNSYLTTTKNFTYGNSSHSYPTLIEETTTNGEKIKTSIKYVADYSGTASGPMASNIRQMQALNMVGIPVEKLQYRQDASGNNTKYISGQITDYSYGNPLNLYFLEAQPPLSSVTPSSITTGSSMLFDSHYRLAASMNYDNLFNLTQQSKTNDAAKSYIWDYNQQYPIAEVTGATNNEISYTSFETSGKGNFTFSGSPTPGSSITGKQYYNLTSNTITGSTNPAKTYTLSYWRNSTTPNNPFSVSGSTSYKQGVIKNGWTYYEHVVSGVSTTNITGSGNIDELRLYPVIAQMSTQTFEPLIGVTSQCTGNNQIVYYEYDGLNRLVNIKDDDGNIVKNFKYNYGLGTAPVTSTQTLWYNAPVQGSYTKQGCTGGSVGQPVIYKIPYGKHVSSLSQPDADAKASADLLSNGQTYANANGLCLFYNTPQSDWFQKTNCSPDNGPPLLTQYTIAAGTFSSTTSVAHANQLAQAALPALGQAYVEAGNFCFCQPTEGIKYINGQCVQGVKKYMGNGTVVNGMYHCPYNYYFSQDGTYSLQSYIEIRSTPCPANN